MGLEQDHSLKSLKFRGDSIADSQYQLKRLNEADGKKFADALKPFGLFPLIPTELGIFQINLGKMCNQACKHCHVDAGPDRKEIMDRSTMEKCLDIIKDNRFHTIDLTGGAPEMNPNFRWFVEQIRALDKDVKIIIRCNLTIILANKKYSDLPQFYKNNLVEVVSSLPFFEAQRTDAQRGNGVFEKSIKALQMLNEVGYGKIDGLKLHLVYNPSGAFLPNDQSELTALFKEKLLAEYSVVFNDLFAITNLPISRFLEYLVKTDNLEDYMYELIEAYNPSAAANVMCRDTLSIGWDGSIYDCDFNQMLDLKVNCSDSDHIDKFNADSLLQRSIVVNQHCYGCTAGSGSSCGGSTV